MNREISLKKFLLFLSIFLIFFVFFLFVLFEHWKPMCQKEPCEMAKCDACSLVDGNKICNDCNLYDNENRKIWTGRCIFK